MPARVWLDAHAAHRRCQFAGKASASRRGSAGRRSRRAKRCASGRTIRDADARRVAAVPDCCRPSGRRSRVAKRPRPAPGGALRCSCCRRPAAAARAARSSTSHKPIKREQHQPDEVAEFGGGRFGPQQIKRADERESGEREPERREVAAAGNQKSAVAAGSPFQRGASRPRRGSRAMASRNGSRSMVSSMRLADATTRLRDGCSAARSSMASRTCAVICSLRMRW